VAAFQPGFVTQAQERARCKGLPVTQPIDDAEAEKPRGFAVRANSILAFIECNDEPRPTLRDTIVDAMLLAQTPIQTKLAERRYHSTVNARTTASSVLTASLGSSSICKPRWPPFK